MARSRTPFVNAIRASGPRMMTARQQQQRRDPPTSLHALNAIREAARLGLLTVQERRREGRRNLPNVIRIVSKAWTSWLARGGQSSRPVAEPLIGVKKITPTDRRDKKEPQHTSNPVLAARRQQADLAAQHHQRRPSESKG